MSLVRKMIPPLSPKLHKGQAGEYESVRGFVPTLSPQLRRLEIMPQAQPFADGRTYRSPGRQRRLLWRTVLRRNGSDALRRRPGPCDLRTKGRSSNQDIVSPINVQADTSSPDLIVHGVLDKDEGLDAAKEAMKSVMERLHVIIIGPGLGRDDFMQDCAREALKIAKEGEMGVVVDADGLWLLNKEPELVKGWKGVPRIILTPNVMEFKRLTEAVVSLRLGELTKGCEGGGSGEEMC